jgi:hypothetical protein
MTAPQPTLFDAVPMTRANDYDTSRNAADRVRAACGPLHRAILAKLAMCPAGEGLTDRELETESAFADLSPSTVRKRRSELFYAGVLTRLGRRDGMTVWGLA